MKTADEMLDEIENANNGDGPDPAATVDDPALARIAVAQIRLRAAERELDWGCAGYDSSGCEQALPRRLTWSTDVAGSST